MSGFEIVGVVLGALPLFVEAGKAYAHGASTIHKVVSQSKRDKKLQEFYENFYWEVVELKRQIEDIVERLPHLSEERKKEILDSDDFDKWNKATDVEDALRNFFATDKDFETFVLVMEKVVRLFDQLIKDETVKISKSDRVRQLVYSTPLHIFLAIVWPVYLGHVLSTCIVRVAACS
jgi:hypothetical protein